MQLNTVTAPDTTIILVEQNDAKVLHEFAHRTDGVRILREFLARFKAKS